MEPAFQPLVFQEIQKTSNCVHIIILWVLLPLSGKQDLLLVVIAVLAVAFLFAVIPFPVEFDAGKEPLPG